MTCFGCPRASLRRLAMGAMPVGLFRLASPQRCRLVRAGTGPAPAGVSAALVNAVGTRRLCRCPVHAIGSSRAGAFPTGSRHRHASCGWLR